MAIEFVTVAHPDIEGTARIPVRSLPARRANGWEPVDPDTDSSPASADETETHVSEPHVPEGDITETPEREDNS